MPASADYLTKYLTASNSNKSGTNPDYDDRSVRPKKRRKKDKHDAGSSSLLIAEDDDDLLLSSKKDKRKIEEDDDPMLLDTKYRSAEFRKKKTSNWQTLDHNGDGPDNNDATQDEASKILAEAVAESDLRRQDQEMEDAPAVVETQQNDNQGGPKMESGVRAGLQTAADTAALLAASEKAQQEEAAAEKRSKKSKKLQNGSPPAEEETIYRDATGRRIDISMRRAEARAAEVEKQRQEKKERENAMGEVQRQQKEERKKDLDEAKFLTLGRSADDEEMNERLKEVVRWDDPMAEYMAQKKAEEDVKSGKDLSRGNRNVTARARKKEYQGAAAPNRYGILPGFRWDGVDRSNGFEKEWFQARGKKARNENLEYQWAMDE